MIYKTTQHDTESDATVAGETFCENWGWGYAPSYTIYFDCMANVWICCACRYSSCD